MAHPHQEIPAQPVCQGLLPSTVREPFMLVVRTAQSLALEAGMDPEVHARRLEHEGLAHIEATLARLKQAILRLPTHCAAHLSLLDHLVQTQLAIASVKGQQSAPPDYLGIERRGAHEPVDADPGRVDRAQGQRA